MSYLGMQYQTNRLATFENGAREGRSRKRHYWPYQVPDIHHVAEFGFYFTPTKSYPDQITCFCCKKKEKNLEGVENIAEFHLGNNPKCAFSFILTAQYNHSLEGSDGFWDSEHAQELRDPFSKSSVAIRRRTFGKYWHFDSGTSVVATSNALAKAGFFFCPVDQGNDRTQCVYCNFCLEGWSKDDDPIEEHRKYQSECYLLIKELQMSREKGRSKGPKTRTLQQKSTRSTPELVETVEGLSADDYNQDLDEGQAVDYDDDDVHIESVDSSLTNVDSFPLRKSKRIQNKSTIESSQGEAELSLLLAEPEMKLERNVYGSKSRNKSSKTGQSKVSGSSEDSDMVDESEDGLNTIENKSDSRHASQPENANISSHNTTGENHKQASGDRDHSKEDFVMSSELYESSSGSDNDMDDSSFELSMSKKLVSKPKPLANKSSNSKQSRPKRNRDAFETSFDEQRFNDVLKSPRKAQKIRIKTSQAQKPSIDLERNLGDYDDNHLHAIENEVGHVFNAKSDRKEHEVPANSGKEKEPPTKLLHLGGPDSSLHDESVGIFDLEKSFDKNRKRQLEYNLIIKDDPEPAEAVALRFPKTSSPLKRQEILDDQSAEESQLALKKSDYGDPYDVKSLGGSTQRRLISKTHTSLFSDTSDEESDEEEKAKPSNPISEKEEQSFANNSKISRSEPKHAQVKSSPVIDQTPQKLPSHRIQDVEQSTPKADLAVSETKVNEDNLMGLSQDSTKPQEQPVTNSTIAQPDLLARLSPNSNKQVSPVSPVSPASLPRVAPTEIEVELKEESPIEKTATPVERSSNGPLSETATKSPSVHEDFLVIKSSSELKEAQKKSSLIDRLTEAPLQSPQLNRISLPKELPQKSSPHIPSMSSPKSFTPIHMKPEPDVKQSDPAPVKESKDSIHHSHIEDQPESKSVNPTILQESIQNDKAPPNSEAIISPETKPKLHEEIERLSASFSNVLEASTPHKTAAGLQKWVPKPLAELLEVIEKLEGASEYLTAIVSSEYDLHNDYDGRLTAFISSMPEEEENMTIQEWVKHNASMCSKVATETCNELIESYREEYTRALRVLEALPTLDE